MNSHRVAISGVLILCAVALSVIAAPNAMALKGTTAYECKPVVKGKIGFTDEHCTKSAGAGEASFEHVLIPAGSTNVTITNHETGEKSPVVRMKAEAFGLKVELEAKKATSCGGTTVENTVNAKKQMEAAGEGCSSFTEVTVSKPSGCKATEPIVANIFGNTSVEEPEKKPVGVTGYVPSKGGGGKTFVSITLSGASCVASGTFEVAGSVKANMPLEEGKADGPTLRFSTAQSEKTLKFAGSPAAFEGTFTMRSASGEKNPVSLTTTES